MTDKALGRKQLLKLLDDHKIPADSELPYEDVTFTDAFGGAEFRIRALSPMERRRSQVWCSQDGEADAWVVRSGIAAMRWGLIDKKGQHLLTTYEEATAFVFTLYEHPKDHKLVGEVISRLSDKVATRLPPATDEDPSQPAAG